MREKGMHILFEISKWPKKTSLIDEQIVEIEISKSKQFFLEWRKVEEVNEREKYAYVVWNFKTT